MSGLNKKFKLGLIGRDIGYSLSPVIHLESAKFLGLDVSYDVFDLASCAGADVVTSGSFALDGFNITKPYKNEIVDFLSDHDLLADKGTPHEAGVNTAQYTPRGWKLYSTDYVGFVGGGAAYGMDVEAFPDIVFLGHGGAVKAILRGLASSRKKTLSRSSSNNSVSMAKGATSISILSRRSEEERLILEKEFSQFFGKDQLSIRFYEWDREVLKDLFLRFPRCLCVQASPVPQMGGDLSELYSDFSNSFEGAFYDLVYAKSNRFLEAFKDSGLRCIDGTPMLIEQARASQNVWWGKSAPYEVISKALKL